jgi:hypothetical protein
MDIEKVKDTIRKLLNLANNEGAAEGEIANAMRFAARLMEQHQLSEEDVSKVDEKLLDLEHAEMAQQSFFAHGEAESIQQWVSSAANFACSFVGGVKWYYQSAVPVRDENGILKLKRTGSPIRRTKMTFYGIAEDVEIAHQVYDELCMTIMAVARLRFGVVYRGSGRSYCEGFMAGLWNKWYNDQDQQRKLAHQPTSGSTALMVIDARKEIVARKEQLAKDWLSTKVKLGKGRSSRSQRDVDYDAYGTGKSDGSKYSASGSRRKKLTN